MAVATARRAPAPEPQPSSDAAPAWVAGGTPLALREALTEVLGRAGVLSSALDLIKYASDASPYRLIPQAVAVPRDTGQSPRSWGGVSGRGRR